MFKNRVFCKKKFLKAPQILQKASEVPTIATFGTATPWTFKNVLFVQAFEPTRASWERKIKISVEKTSSLHSDVVRLTFGEPCINIILWESQFTILPHEQNYISCKPSVRLTFGDLICASTLFCAQIVVDAQMGSPKVNLTKGLQLI